LTADFLHVGAFKGAAEPLTRDAPSPEMLETMNAILDQRYASMLGMLETSRRLSRAEAAAIIDEGMLPAPRALATKAVDVVEPFEAFRSGWPATPGARSGSRLIRPPIRRPQ
jgi:protease-4